MLNDDDVIWSDFHLFICRDKMLSNDMAINYKYSMKTANMQHTIIADMSRWDHTRVIIRGSGGQPLNLLNLPLSLLFKVTCI